MTPTIFTEDEMAKHFLTTMFFCSKLKLVLQGGPLEGHWMEPQEWRPRVVFGERQGRGSKLGGFTS